MGIQVGIRNQVRVPCCRLRQPGRGRACRADAEGDEDHVGRDRVAYDPTASRRSSRSRAFSAAFRGAWRA